MSDHPVSRILSKIPLPELPTFTCDSNKDMEILTTYEDNLSKYEKTINKLCSEVFTPLFAKHGIFTEAQQKLKDIKSAVSKDLTRLNTGFGVKFTIDLLGCKKLPVRISKETLKNNFNLINESNNIYIDDTFSVCIVKFDQSKVQFSIPECPCCDQDSISNKQELLSHLKKTHISYKSSKKKWDHPVFNIQKVEHNDMMTTATADTEKILTNHINSIYISYSPPQDLQNLKDTLIEYLKNRFRVQMPDCELIKYGSTNNGFCLQSSDIDLCLIVNEKSVFKHQKYYNLLIQEIGENATSSLCEILALSKVYDTLKNDNVGELEMIEGARVKIVSFITPTDPAFHVDVCVNRRVVIENTRLIRTYSLIDPRVAKIGVIVKMWAKKLGIADPKNGTLSSYAYIILVIYFFQRIPNPILPSLQEGVIVKNYVNDFDCSFQEDYRIFTEQSKLNTESEGKLLLEFFKFYSFFDWKQNTVDIKKLQNVKKMNKDSQLFISIQDPFEPLRNLGDVIINQDVSFHIINCFKKAYVDFSRGISLSTIIIK